MMPDAPTRVGPLRTDEHGAIRIGKTRVMLELLIPAYHMNETPEGLSIAIPTCRVLRMHGLKEHDQCRNRA